MKETNGMKIVERIDIALRKKGENDRVQLCKILNIPKSTISGWSSLGNVPKLEQAFALARYLNVSLEWLVYGEENEQKSELEQKYSQLNESGKIAVDSILNNPNMQIPEYEVKIG